MYRYGYEKRSYRNNIKRTAIIAASLKSKEALGRQLQARFIMKAVVLVTVCNVRSSSFKSLQLVGLTLFPKEDFRLNFILFNENF